jgi:hypothetical protein
VVVLGSQAGRAGAGGGLQASRRGLSTLAACPE